MSTATKDPIPVMMPSIDTCMKSYFDKRVVAATEKATKIAKSIGVAEVEEAIYDIVEDMEDTAEAFVKDYAKYLKSTYNKMWDSSSFWTGNFRGSLKFAGDFSKDPIHCAIVFDLDWFTTPKTLPTLKDKTVSRTWVTKAGDKHSSTYRYPAGRYMVKITGEDYRKRVPPTPYVMAFLDEIDDAEKAAAGVN